MTRTTLHSAGRAWVHISLVWTALVAPMVPALADESGWLLEDSVICPTNDDYGDPPGLWLDCGSEEIVIRKALFYIVRARDCSSSQECRQCSLQAGRKLTVDREIWTCNGVETCYLSYADILNDRFRACGCEAIKMEVEYQCADRFNVHHLSEVCPNPGAAIPGYVITPLNELNHHLMYPCTFSFAVTDGYMHIVDIHAMSGLVVTVCPSSERSECQQVSAPKRMTFRGPGRLTFKKNGMPPRNGRWLTLNYTKVRSTRLPTTERTSLATFPAQTNVTRDKTIVIVVSLVIVLALVTTLGIICYLVISRRLSKRPPGQGPRLLSLNQLRRRIRPQQNEYASSTAPPTGVARLAADPTRAEPRPWTPRDEGQANTAHTAASSDNEDSDNENFETVPDEATLRDIRSRHSDVIVGADSHVP